jgi:hypothetical protein
MLRIFAAFCALVLCTGSLSAAAQAPVPVQDASGQTAVVITLKDGVKIRFVSGRTVTPEGGGAETRALVVTFDLLDKSLLADHAKLIEIADQLFGGIVLVPADTQGLTKAVVGFLISETKSGEQTIQEIEDFHYARGSDAVWLRQAGPEPWKTAQDPKDWTPPTIEIVDLGEYGKADIAFFGEALNVPGLIKALGIEMRTDTPVEVGRKWEEIRALWHQIDREKLKAEGYNFALIQNFAEAARGKFHVRKFAYYRIPRPANGDWAPLPEGPLGPLGQPAVVASLPPLPMPGADAMGAAMTAVLKAAAPPQPAVAVEGAVASGEGLVLHAADTGAGKRGIRLKTYLPKPRR